MLRRVHDSHGDQRPVRDHGRPDGNLWFTEEDGNKIGRITPAGTIAEFTGEWFILRSSDGGLTHTNWGSPALGDVPVPAKY